MFGFRRRRSVPPDDSGAAQGEPPPPSGYLGDAPIGDTDPDLLHRKPFAHRIADTISSRTDPSSVVVGIYGQWGEGKTTVLNFIEQRLAQSDAIVCVRFNPWLYQGESQLLLSFFETLASAVGQSLKTKKEEMGKWLRTLGTALSTVSVGVGLINASPGSAIQNLGESLSSVDIQDKRGQLEALLCESGTRIVIMIDDIDRLDDNEIATIFKLVKLAADFTHTAYILAFDQAVVTKALAKRYADSEESGSSFIEKIVQVPIELPRSDESVLQTMTLQAMTRILEAAEIELADDDVNRFSLVFQRHLAPHIGTPRMAKRIANAIEFAIPLLANEVNVADLLLVHTMSVLFPSLYRKMPAVKDALLGRLFDVPMNNVQDMVKEQLAPLFEGLDGDDLKDVTGALRELFPRIERIYSNTHWGPEWVAEWHAAQRICAPDYFDRFFSYGIPIGDLADADLRTFLSQVTSRADEENAEALRALFEKASAKRVVDKLRPLETTFDAQTAEAVAAALTRLSKIIPDPLMGPTATYSSPFPQAAMHIANILGRIDAVDREPLVRRIITSSPSLPFAGEVLRWSTAVSGDKAPPEARPLTPTDISGLEGALGERIAKEADEAPLFISMPKYAPNLYYDWRRGAGSAAVEDHLRSACAGNAENCVALLRAFMPMAWSMQTGLPVGSQIERNTYDSIVGLLPAEVIIETFSAAFPNTQKSDPSADTSGLPENDRIALRFAHIHRLVVTQTAVSPEAEPPPAV